MVYRLSIKMDSPIHGSINSNTIFGVICTAYKIKYGEDELKKLLQNITKSIDELVLSDPLKRDTLEFIDRDSITQINKVILDRLDNENNELYMSQALCVKEFDVILCTTIPEEKIREILDICSILGLGSSKNNGFGKIQKIEMSEERIAKTDKKTVKCLANIFPSDNTPIHGNINYTVRHGITCDGKVQKSIIMIKAGSELLNTGISITGQLLYDVDTDTYINGKSILI